MNLPDAVPQINMTNLPTVGGGRVVLNKHDLFIYVYFQGQPVHLLQDNPIPTVKTPPK